MPGPIRTARKFTEFRSFNKLADALIAAFPTKDWGKTRILGNRLGDLDKGSITWWRNNKEKSSRLADFLEVSLQDLGLHDKTNGLDFPFADFPELPPLDLKREDIWRITFVEQPSSLNSQRIVQVGLQRHLENWLAGPPAWVNRPPTESEWVWMDDDLHRRLLVQKLCASSPYDVIFAETLAEAEPRLTNPKPVIVAVEKDGGADDRRALANRPENAGILVVAPFAIHQEAIDAEVLISWELRSAWSERATEGHESQITKTTLTPLDGSLLCQALVLSPDWRTLMIDWVGLRLDRHNLDTLFSAKAIKHWLNNFDPEARWFRTTADILQLCRLAHFYSEKCLPSTSDPHAGMRLCDRLSERDASARPYQIELLATSRWHSGLPWEGPLSLAQWLKCSGDAVAAISPADLHKIAIGDSAEERRKVVDEVSARLTAGNPDALLRSGLLDETRRGSFDFRYRMFANLAIRDRLVAQVASEPVESWAMSCFDPTRRPLIDAALDATSMDVLCNAAHRLAAAPSDSAQSVAAAEALFVAIGKRIIRHETVPDTLFSIASTVVLRLSAPTVEVLTRPWSRPTESIDDQLAWVSACWSWSLVPGAAVDGAPAWLFPGWVSRLPPPPDWLRQLSPGDDIETRSPAFAAFFRVAVEWIKEIDAPASSWPTFIFAPFLLRAMRGGGTPQSGWWKAMIGKKWAEQLLLEGLSAAGRDAVSRVWPSFIAAERETAMERDSPEHRELHLIKFQLSEIRIWLLRHLAPDDALKGLSGADIGYLARHPSTLPPAVRPFLLTAVREFPPVVDPFDARNYLARFGASAAPALESYLDDNWYGLDAAWLIWRWNAGRALALLQDKTISTLIRSRLYWECPADHFPQALELLSDDPDMFDAAEFELWVRPFLPTAGALAQWALSLLATRQHSRTV